MSRPHRDLRTAPRTPPISDDHSAEPSDAQVQEQHLGAQNVERLDDFSSPGTARHALVIPIWVMSHTGVHELGPPTVGARWQHDRASSGELTTLHGDGQLMTEVATLALRPGGLLWLACPGEKSG